MGYVKCEKCKKDYFVDHDNPNIHYAPINKNEVKMCRWCSNFESLKDGDWYQNENGEYLQKGKP